MIGMSYSPAARPSLFTSSQIFSCMPDFSETGVSGRGSSSLRILPSVWRDTSKLLRQFSGNSTLMGIFSVFSAFTVIVMNRLLRSGRSRSIRSGKRCLALSSPIESQ